MSNFPKAFMSVYILIIMIVTVGIYLIYKTNKKVKGLLLKDFKNLVFKNQYYLDFFYILFICIIPFLFTWRFFTNIPDAKLFLHYGDQLLFYGHMFFSNIAIHKGLMPFWDPFIGFGFPIFNIARNCIFHLPNMIIFSLAGEVLDNIEFTIYVVFHFSLLGSFTYLALKVLKFSRFSSLIGGIISAISPFFIFVSFLVVDFSWLIIYVPLLFVIIYKFINKPSTGKIIIGGLICALMGLTIQTNNLLFSFYIFVGIVIYLLVKSYENKESLFKKIKGLISMGIIGVGLSAIQLLPSTYYLIKSDRVSNVANYFDSFIFCSIDVGINAIMQNPFLYMIYLGNFLIIIFMLIGIWIHRENKLVAIAVSILLIAFSFSFGPMSWIYDFSYNLLPGFDKFRWFFRINRFTPFFIALLTAFGISVLEKEQNIEGETILNKSKNILGILALSSFFILFLVYPEKSFNETHRSYIFRDAIFKSDWVFLLGTKARSLFIICLSSLFMFFVLETRNRKKKLTKSLKIFILFALLSLGYAEYNSLVWTNTNNFSSNGDPIFKSADMLGTQIENREIEEVTSFRTLGSENINDIVELTPIAYHNVEGMNERVVRFCRWVGIAYRSDDTEAYAVSKGDSQALMSLANIKEKDDSIFMPRAFLVKDGAVSDIKSHRDFLIQLEHVKDWHEIVLLEKNFKIITENKLILDLSKKFFKNMDKFVKDKNKVLELEQYMNELPASPLAHFMYGQYLESKNSYQRAYNHYFFSNLLSVNDRAKKSMSKLDKKNDLLKNNLQIPDIGLLLSKNRLNDLILKLENRGGGSISNFDKGLSVKFECNLKNVRNQYQNLYRIFDSKGEEILKVYLQKNNSEFNNELTIKQGNAWVLFKKPPVNKHLTITLNYDFEKKSVEVFYDGVKQTSIFGDNKFNMRPLGLLNIVLGRDYFHEKKVSFYGKVFKLNVYRYDRNENKHLMKCEITDYTDDNKKEYEINSLDFVNIYNSNQPKKLYSKALLQKYNEYKEYVKFVEFDFNKVKIKFRNDNSKFLFYSDAWDPGWHAKLNGKQKLPVYRANYVFKAVPIPQGEGEVTFYFIPKYYTLGKWISIATSLILLFMSILLIKGYIKTKYLGDKE